MPRKRGEWQSERCRCCSHPELGQLNYSLAKGISASAVARRYGLGISGVINHFKKHVSEVYKKVIGSGIYADIDELLKACVKGDAESLDILNATISGHFHQFSLAFANGSQADMVRHSAALRQLIELRSRINRELQPNYGSVTNNVLIQGDVTTLLQILQPFPEARQAIVDHYARAPQQIEHAAVGD